MGVPEPAFQILMVDDNQNDMRLVERFLKAQHRPFRLQWKNDGVGLLELLESRKSCASDEHPSMILLDVNMPRVNGLEALRAIRKQPDWRFIPVIVLSSGAAPAKVREAYESGASCFVQKPTHLDDWRRLVENMLAFWSDQVLQTAHLQAQAASANIGTTVASSPVEARSQAISMNKTGSKAALSEILYCEEHRGLMENFAMTVKELLDLHEQQFHAIIDGDPDCQRFDLLIHMANERKQLAKYAYVLHVESHGCLNFDATNNC